MYFICITLSEANICKDCHCLEEENDLLTIRCNSTTSKKLDLNFEHLEWPQTERFIKVHFNQLGLYVLPPK